MSKFCNNCGTKLDEGLNFCSECGTPVNRNEEVVTYQVANVAQKKNPALFITSWILTLVVLVAPFLPFATAGSQSINYISNFDQPADGILIIGLFVFSSLFLAFKKKIPVIISSILSLCILLYDVSNINNLIFSSFVNYGIGFYLLLLSLIAILIISFIRLFAGKKFM